MLQEKQFYLKCLAEGPVSHRKVANRMAVKFQTSPAAIKNALLRDGLIELHEKKRKGQTNKYNHYYKLTDKKLMQVAEIESEITVSDTWEDGTPKSKGNAFDLSLIKRSMFDNREVARMTQKYHQNKPITIYSRA